MLEQKDLEMLKGIMESVVQESENKMMAKMDSRFQESENKMMAKMDSRFQESENKMMAKMDSLIHESENTILEELDRVQINLGKRIDKVEKNLDELNQYYRITKLENDNTAILLKMIQDQAKTIDELSKRVAVLENDKKSA